MGDTYARFTFENFLKTIWQSAPPFYLTDLLDLLILSRTTYTWAIKYHQLGESLTRFACYFFVPTEWAMPLEGGGAKPQAEPGKHASHAGLSSSFVLNNIYELKNKLILVSFNHKAEVFSECNRVLRNSIKH